VVKDGFEIKSAQRVLFDSNTIENVWAAGQLGFGIVLTVRSGQSGDIAVINDITITNNVLKNVVSGFNTLMGDDTCGSAYPNCHNPGSANRWNISNNLLVHYDPKILGGSRNAFIQINGGWDKVSPGCTVAVPCYIPSRNIVFQHNTEVTPASTPACWGSVYWSVPGYGAPKPGQVISDNVWILDNVLCKQVSGDGGVQGTAAVNGYMGAPSAAPYDINARFHGNVMYVPVGQKVQTFPPHNYAATIPFTYINPSSGNYQLLTPYWTDTSDGSIAGVQSISLPTSPSNQIPRPTPVANNLGGTNYSSPPPTLVSIKPTAGTAAH
jgi:hypothetical protein